MKKFLFILLAIVLIGGGVFAYFNFFGQVKLTTWDFVPADAAFVYESDNPLQQLRESRKKKIWANLSNLPALDRVYQNLDILDSISGNNGSLPSFFESNEMLVSFHIISKNALDVLLTIEVKNLDQHHLLSMAIDHYSKTDDLSQDTRQYLGHTITELSADNVNFAYIFYKSFFIGSFTPFLVEDAIRVIEDEDIKSFSDQHQEIFSITRLEKDQGNVFVNTRKLDEMGGIFADPIKADLESLSSLSEVSFLDLSINEDNILMTGFSLNDPKKANYLDAFDDVESGEFEMSEVTPNNTAALFHFSFDDVQKWHSGLKNYWRKTEPSLLTRLGEIENKYDVSIADTYDFIDTELGLIMVESVNPKKPDMVFCMKVSNDVSANEFFQKLSKATLSEDQQYEESWSDVRLGHIEIEDLPARLFGPIFTGFPSSFYCQIGKFFFIGNNEQVLKQLIDNINAEGTWRKSIKVNNFLNIANREANLSLFVNTPGAWNMITEHINGKWKTQFNEESFKLKQVEFASFQFSNVDGKYYTNIALQHPGQFIERTESSEFELKSELEFENKLITRPYAVRNHNDKSLEMIVQDSLNNMFLVSSGIDTLWNKEIEGKINGSINQIDYYKNGKLQYLFATDSSIHIIDRIGEYVSGFPMKLPTNEPISCLSLIDYDNSRNYRIMAGTKDGEYYLFDKNGVNLEGWQPNSLEGNPVMNPFHLRVRARDYMMFLHRNGLVYVLNRRGEPVSGFPLDLKGQTDNVLFTQKGGNASSTKFTALTNDGELVEFSLEGKFLKREQLFKTTASDKFKLVISSNNRDYMVVRSDDEKVTVINSEGEELFDHLYEIPDVQAKYYNFGVDNKVVVIIDVEKQYTYLYNQDGKVLHSLPLETGAEIAMLYYESDGEYKLYKTFRNKLSVLTLKR